MPRVLIRPELNLTIPAAVLAVLGWDDTTVLDLQVSNGALVIVPAGRPSEQAQPPVRTEPPPAPEPTRRTDDRGHPVLEGAALHALGVRIELGLTRSEAALASGIPYETLTAWEDGWTQPSPEHVSSLEALLANPDGARERARALQPEYTG